MSTNNGYEAERAANQAEDDREEFEQDHVHQDGEADLDQEAWALQEQPGTLTIRNETDEPVEYRVVPLEPVSTAEAVLRNVDADMDERLEAAQAIADLGSEVREFVLVGHEHDGFEERPAEPRFGERLRVAARRNGLMAVDEIADAIDQDAAELNIRANVAQSALARVLREKEHLRRQVEDAVERLRYTVGTYTNTKKDVLDAEPVLAELDRIFGERPEEEEGAQIWARLTAKQRQDLLAQLDPAAGVRLIARLCTGIEATRYGGTMGEEAETELALLDAKELLTRVGFLPEHVPAAERRERHAAKFEDRDGRVEGVDR